MTLSFFSCICKGVFSKVVGGKKRKQDFDRPKSKKKRHSGRDEEFYIPYRPKDFESERGYGAVILTLICNNWSKQQLVFRSLRFYCVEIASHYKRYLNVVKIHQYDKTGLSHSPPRISRTSKNNNNCNF